MKKRLLLLALLFGIIARFHATPLKYRLHRVEEGVRFLAHDATQSWQAIAQLNNEVTELERKIYKKFSHPPVSYGKMKQKCNKKKKIKFDNLYDVIIDDIKSN